MPSLTYAESRHRAELLTVTSYDVTLDLTGDEKTFASRTVVELTADRSGTTFVDLKPVRVGSVALNGRPVDPDLLADGRLPLEVVAGRNQLVVEAVMGYRNDGEGLHRAVDPADGLHYTYAMSFLDAAPRIFACFDQPDLKAPYTLHVRAPREWVVLGNGRAEQVEPGVWELATTQPLSTYFVTLVAGPYHQVTDAHDGVALGLASRRSLAPHLDKDAEEILTVTRQCFDEFHRLFGVRYAFGDYHQAFVPEFNAGAMENPGCVTFRDPLVFTSKVTRAQRTSRATTIAHEMAHQWFGDLVTMRWWDDLWLNESFAEYMGNRVAHDVTEFTDAWVDVAFGRKRWGLETDQRPTTHPVAGNGAQDALTALQDFDGISYAKGSAVLKQLNRRLGDEVFFAGVRAHFEQHRFGNATMHDLFSAWEAAGAGDLGPWTEGWLRSAGVDLIAPERTAEGVVLCRQTPEAHPAYREHALTAAVLDGPVHGAAGAAAPAWRLHHLTVADEPVAVPAADRPVLLDPAEEAWARLGLDDLTLAALPQLLPAMSDPLMRASVWNAVQDGVDNALVDPADALALVEAGLPTEDQDLALAALGRFATRSLADRLLADPAGARSRVHAAALSRLASAAPGSGVQLAALRAAVTTSADDAALRRWLDGTDLPHGTTVDLDLRWRILVRLAVLGAVDEAELERWLEHERTTEAAVHLVQARSALPTAAAKRFAWEHFDGSRTASNYEIEAAGLGLWQRGQEELTEGYVGRYFAEVPGTTAFRSGWVLADAAREFFPRLALREETVVQAEAVLASDDLDPSLRRALVDCTDDLTRGLRARWTFPASGL